MASDVPPQLASLEKEVRDIFKLLSIGFQRLDKMKDVERQIKQLEELTAKMREAKRMIKEYDRDIKEDEGRDPQTKKLLTEKKQSLIKELNSYVALRKTYTSSFGSKHELLDGGSFSGSVRDVDVRTVASTVSNQEVMETGKKEMDETDQATERTEKAMEDTINTAAETTVTSKEPTEQLSRMNKALKLVNKIPTDRCLMFFLLLIVVIVVAILIVKLVHPSSEGVQAPGSTPPAHSRRLLHLN